MGFLRSADDWDFYWRTRLANLYRFGLGNIANNLIDGRSQVWSLSKDDLAISLVFFEWPFVKRFALSYRTVVCLSCLLCDVGVLWPNGWMDEDETWHGGRPNLALATLCKMGTQLHLRQRGTTPNFRPIYVVAKRLYGSRCHLVRR